MPGAQQLMMGLLFRVSSSATITNQTITSVGGGAPPATYRLNANGNVYSVTNAGTTLLETWLGSGAASGYDAKLTVNSTTGTNGGLSGGISGTWYNLGTTRDWTWTKSSGLGTATANCTVEIRDASTGTVLDTATITLNSQIV